MLSLPLCISMIEPGRTCESTKSATCCAPILPNHIRPRSTYTASGPRIVRPAPLADSSCRRVGEGNVALSCYRQDCGLRLHHFSATQYRTAGSPFPMCIAMVRDLHPGVGDLLRQLGILHYVTPDNKERRRHALLAQYIEQRLRQTWIWAVVKGERPRPSRL